jgi:hypothetical protein
MSPFTLRGLNDRRVIAKGASGYSSRQRIPARGQCIICGGSLGTKRKNLAITCPLSECSISSAPMPTIMPAVNARTVFIAEHKAPEFWRFRGRLAHDGTLARKVRKIDEVTQPV